MNNKERSHLRRAYERTTRFNQFKLIIVSLLLIVYSFLLVVVIPIQTYYVLIKRSDSVTTALQSQAIEAMQSFVQNLPDEMSVPNISSEQATLQINSTVYQVQLWVGIAAVMHTLIWMYWFVRLIKHLNEFTDRSLRKQIYPYPKQKQRQFKQE